MTPALEELVRFIRSEASRALGLTAMIEEDDDLFDLGMDSIDAVQLTAAIEVRFDIGVDPNLAFEEATARKIAMAIAGRLD